jgi:hypothetical protein
MADPHIEDRDTTWVRTAKDLFSGAAGGVAQVLLGIMNSLLFRPFRASVHNCGPYQSN